MIQVGDLIHEVGYVNVYSMSPMEVIRALMGKPGSPVFLLTSQGSMSYLPQHTVSSSCTPARICVDISHIGPSAVLFEPRREWEAWISVYEDSNWSLRSCESNPQRELSFSCSRILTIIRALQPMLDLLKATSSTLSTISGK